MWGGVFYFSFSFSQRYQYESRMKTFAVVHIKNSPVAKGWQHQKWSCALCPRIWLNSSHTHTFLTRFGPYAIDSIWFDPIHWFRTSLASIKAGKCHRFGPQITWSSFAFQYAFHKKMPPIICHMLWFFSIFLLSYILFFFVLF